MTLRERETKSIRDWLMSQKKLLKGSVLDLGCGRQPYRDIVEYAGGKYVGWDRMSLPGAVHDGDDTGSEAVLGREYDTVMMTQVWQYIPLAELQAMLVLLAEGMWVLKPGGHLIVTGPTNWPVIEKADLHRFTVSGVVALLGTSGFPLMHAETRQNVVHAEGEPWSCGWAAWARSAQP